tara:strand:- start:1106 stop:1306 length:201 start_codon:yes stop_codon:yes gene_type:complete
MIERFSGMIGDEEVEMHKLSKFVWAIDIVRHTSDTKELVEGWVVGDEYKALALYDEKVKELQEMIE